jgi:predicted SAM-dependent methyltransferase
MASDIVCLNLGAGGTAYPGWISAEQYQLDITKPSDFAYFFRQKKISKILAEHVVEHVYEDDFRGFLCSVKQYLEPMANIRIAVPDAYHPSGYVRELTKPGGLEPGAEDHKVFYDVDRMREIALETDYHFESIEFFDIDGLFHSKLLDWNNGYISRSSTEYAGRFTYSEDEHKKMFESIPTQLRGQFLDIGISYTSLIVDFQNTNP